MLPLAFLGKDNKSFEGRFQKFTFSLVNRGNTQRSSTTLSLLRRARRASADQPQQTRCGPLNPRLLSQISNKQQPLPSRGGRHQTPRGARPLSPAPGRSSLAAARGPAPPRRAGAGAGAGRGSPPPAPRKAAGARVCPPPDIASSPGPLQRPRRSQPRHSCLPRTTTGPGRPHSRRPGLLGAPGPAPGGAALPPRAPHAPRPATRADPELGGGVSVARGCPGTHPPRPARPPAQRLTDRPAGPPLPRAPPPAPHRPAARPPPLASGPRPARRRDLTSDGAAGPGRPGPRGKRRVVREMEGGLGNLVKRRYQAEKGVGRENTLPGRFEF